MTVPANTDPRTHALDGAPEVLGVLADELDGLADLIAGTLEWSDDAPWTPDDYRRHAAYRDVMSAAELLADAAARLTNPAAPVPYSIAPGVIAG